MTIKASPLTLVAVLAAGAWPASAQETLSAQERGTLERGVLEALQAEQQAFRAGDCETALRFFASEVIFVVNGRRRPRAAMEALCASLAVDGPPFSRELAQHEVYILSSTSAHTITTYVVSLPSVDAEPRTVPQVVTKVWAMDDGAWRIVHVHESMDRPGPG